MGSGKTVLGVRLADKLSFGFVDLDAQIESVEGRSIPSIFEAEGERTFRRIERKHLRLTRGLQDHVIAVGGGALLSWRAMRWARRNGVVVFIDVPIDELVRRLLESDGGRPLIAEALAEDEPESALRSRVTRMMRVRRPAYERADLTFRPGQESLDQDVLALERLVRSRIDRSEDPDRRG
ncbi:MAG: shikimate kinase [Rhodothermia bacterium]|nr:shikimate kinase [Rhodothermia bacterium]